MEKNPHRSSSDEMGKKLKDVKFFKIYKIYILIIEFSFNQMWQHIVLLSIISSYAIQTFVLAFFSTFPGYFACRIILDTIYIADLMLSIVYLVTYKVIKAIYKPRRIFFIVLDILSIFSFDYLIDFGDNSRINGLFICMQILLFLRCYRIIVYANPSKAKIGRPSVLGLITTLGLVTYLTMHTFTCLFIYTCGFVNGPWTRGLINKDIVIRTPGDEFIVSTYFLSLYFCGTGYGDLVAVTIPERVIVMIAMAMGITWIGIAVASLTSFHNDTSQHHFRFSAHLQLIQDDLHENRSIPLGVKEKILDYYSNLWIYKSGIVSSEIFEQLPTNMRNVVLCDQYWECLEKSILLRDLDNASKRALASVMRSQIYVNGDVIVRKGELRTSMMLVVRGIIKVLSSEDAESTIMMLGEGTLVNEIALVLSTPCPVQLEAGAFCELQILNRAHLYLTAMTYRQISYVIFRTFIDLWERALGEEDEIIDEKVVATALGIRGNVWSRNTTEVQPENERPYTWLHHDEMVHLVERPKILHKSLNVYVSCKMTKQASDAMCARTKFPFVFHPGTSLLFAWDLVVVVAAVLASLFYPWRAATGSHAFQTLLLLINVLYITDFLISIMTAIDHNGEILDTLTDILPHRLTHTRTLMIIFIDIVSFLPLTLFYQGEDETFLLLLELNHVLKIWKVPRFVGQLENKYIVNLAVVRTVACLLWITVLSFWMGSFYYIQACYGGSCRDATWYRNELVKDIETRAALARSQHHHELILFLGIGFVGGAGIADIQPSTITEMLFVLGLSIISMFISSYFIGKYNAILKLVKSSETAFKELVFVIELFMDNNMITQDIQARIVRYLKLQWQHRQGFYILNDGSLYYDSPRHLEKEVMASLRREELLAVPLLEDTDMSVINYIAYNAKWYMIPPGEVIMYAGEPCREFYVVSEGYCEKYSGLSGELECTLGPKDNFCVMELLFGISSASEIRTVTNVKLLGVTRNVLQNALCKSPVAQNEVTEIFKQFVEKDHLRNVLERKRTRLDGRLLKRQKASWIIFSDKTEDYLKHFRRHWTRSIRFLLLSRTFVPNGRMFRSWETFRIITIIVASLFFPTYSYMWLEYPELKYLRYFMDFLSLVDIYILMHVCYYSHDGILVCHPRATIQNYLRNNFFIDFLVLLPLDSLSETMRIEDIASNKIYFRNQTVTNYLYFHKLLSLYRLQSTSEFAEIGESQTFKKWFQDIQFFSCCLIMLNTFAAILVLLSAEMRFTEDGSEYKIVYPQACWIQNKDVNDQSISELHITALYWTTCMTFCVAFGDISPLNSTDMMYCVVIFLCGYALVTYMMVRITSQISGFGEYFTTYQRNLKEMTQFLVEKKVTPRLQFDIVDHFIHVWSATHSLDPQSILSKFHFALRQDTVLNLYESTFKNCSVFDSADFYFYRQLGSLAQEEYYKEGAKICQVNDIVSDMFFVHSGKISILGVGEGYPAIVNRGGILGNIANVSSCRVTVEVMAITHVVLLRMNNSQVHSLLHDYEEIEKNVLEEVYFNKVYIHSNLDSVTPVSKPVHRKPKVIIAKPTYSRKRMIKDFGAKFAKKFYENCSEIILLCSTSSIILITYHAAFQDHSLKVFTAEILLTCIFFIYPIVRLRCQEKNKILTKKEQKATEKNGGRILYHLKTSELWLDIFSFLPLNLFCFIAPKSLQAETWSYINFTYIIRGYYIVRYFNKKRTYQRLNEKKIKFNLLQMLIYPTILLHLTACIMYCVDCFKNNCDKDKWAYVPSGDDEENFTCESRYVCALYWAIEVYSGAGVGDIVPETISVIVLLLILIVFSQFVVCNVVGQLASLVAEHVFTESNYKFQMPILSKYLKCCNVSYPQIRDIESYAENLWYTQFGKQTPTFFNKLPPYLKSALMNEMYGYHIYDNVLFAGSHPDFLRQLTLHLEYSRYFAGNVIVQSGDLNGTMYFVDSGEVAVLLVEGLDITLTDVLKKGDVFGLIQGLYRRTPHTRTFRATMSTGILSLSYDNWCSLLSFFPETYKELYERAYIFSFLP